MEMEGLVKADWGMTEKKREARFYSLTPKGKKQLQEKKRRSWNRLTEGVTRVLRLA